MPVAPVVPLDGGGILDDSPVPLPPLLPDHHSRDHDLDIHAPSFPSAIPDPMPILSIHDPVYYTSFPDCNSFPPLYPPHDAHIPHSDLHFILHNESDSPFVHPSPHLSPKNIHHTHDLGLRGPSSLHDARFHSTQSSPSLTYLPPLHDLVCPVDHVFSTPSLPLKHPALTHSLLPPIVQSSPPDLGRADAENRSPIKRTVTNTASQVDPCASAFLRDQLGEARWNTFSARLFERRLGPIKLKIRVRDKNDASPSPGATAIDFLVKVEVVKEVLRTYVPHPYNPLKSLSHPYPPSPSGSVTLTRSTVLILSGWSNTQFSYWARRAEGISVLAAHDERLQAVAIALQKRINDGGVLLDDADKTYTTQGCPNVTGKGLDILIDEVKKRTGFSPFLRGKHSSLDPFGSTNGEKDACSVPHQNVPAAPIYMPTFQAMEYSHGPAITAESPSIGCRRPKKKRRISVADSISSYGSSSGLKADPSDDPTNHFSFPLADNPRLTPDQESVSSSDMQPTSPPSTIMLPHLLDSPRVNENDLSPYELAPRRMRSADEGRSEYFPVSHSRSDVDHSDSESLPGESFSRKRYRGMTTDFEKRLQLSV